MQLSSWKTLKYVSQVWAWKSTFSTVNVMKLKVRPTLSDENVVVSVKRTGFHSLSTEWTNVSYLICIFYTHHLLEIFWLYWIKHNVLRLTSSTFLKLVFKEWLLNKVEDVGAENGWSLPASGQRRPAQVCGWREVSPCAVASVFSQPC